MLGIYTLLDAVPISSPKRFKLHSEMEDAKPSLKMDIKEVTTDFAHSWDIDKIMGLVVEKITWSARETETRRRTSAICRLQVNDARVLV